MAIKNLRQAKQHRRGLKGRRVRDFFCEELAACKETDTPGKIIFYCRDAAGVRTPLGSGGYKSNDEQHPIAQRIGPELQPFLDDLSSDPDFYRGRGVCTQGETWLVVILCCIIGPLALPCCCYCVSQRDKRGIRGRKKFLDSVHDMAKRHGLRAYVSPQTSYFTFTDPTVMVTQQYLVQQPMMMMGTPQAMPAPGQGMYQQQPAYAPHGQGMYQQQPAYAPPPTGELPIMPQGYAQAPQGYAPQPQNGNYGAPPIQTYDPMNVKE